MTKRIVGVLALCMAVVATFSVVGCVPLTVSTGLILAETSARMMASASIPTMTPVELDEFIADIERGKEISGRIDSLLVDVYNQAVAERERRAAASE